MRRLVLYVISLLIAINGICWPAIINIPADYPAIQQGIDASSDGDTVLVQPGTYVENLLIYDKNMVLASNYIFSSDTLDIVNTMVDGESYTGVIINILDCESLTRITGFRFKDENTSSDKAIYANNCDSVIIENNLFESFYYSYVIGTYYNSNVDIINNIFRYNFSNQPRSILSCRDDEPNGTLIKNNVFHDNTGVLLISPDRDLVVENNVIFNNEGIIFWCFFSGSVTITENLIFDNRYNLYGDEGGIFTAENTQIYATRNTICNNSGINNSFLGLFASDLSSRPPIFTSNIIWGNSYPNSDSTLFFPPGDQPIMTFCDIQGGWPGAGNIECDPQFCDPDSGNFYLEGNSCCIGAGLDGSDIGVFGLGCWFPCQDYVVGDVNGSGDFNGLDITYGVSYLKGGPAPTYACECVSGNVLYPSGDINASCSYNGLDITYGVAYLKGGSYLYPCPDCPPVE